MSSTSPSTSITLVQYPGLTEHATLSPPCAKAHMALRFKGLDYSVRNVNSPMEAKRFNPRGRVPVLVIGEERIADSTDIVTALEARFPDPPLDRSDPGERAMVKIFEDWADEVLYFYGVYIRWCVPENFERMRTEVLSRSPIPLRWVLPGIARRELRRRVRGQGVGLKSDDVIRRETGECLQAIVAVLRSRPFLVGGELTRADIAVAAVLDQWRIARLTPRLAAEMDALPEIAEWLGRVHERAPAAT